MKNILYFLLILSALLQACTSAPAIPTEALSPVVMQTSTVIAPTSYPAVNGNAIKTGQHPYSYLTSSGEEVRYLMYLPDNLNSREEWPLILFLHGQGAEGTGHNTEKIIKEGGLPDRLETDKEFPFIVVSPQLPSGLWPSYTDNVDELLTYLSKTISVDTNRLYLTGVSRGAYGVWQYALKYPDRFVAIAPIAGGASQSSDPVPDDICTLKNLPIWVFHGEADLVVRPELDKAVVSALESCGNDIKFTLYPDAGHKDTWILAYADSALYEWFLEHSK
jgi:predicted peptidase